MKATAIARSNIALVKYWGKRDSALNLPAVGSISITLEGLSTTTTVDFDAGLDADELVLNGERRSADAARSELSRVSACLDLLRDLAGVRQHARIDSQNDFPTAAGLASSASGFAALVAAADKALGLGLSGRELSILARRGSGSAARSIYGGIVEMHVGLAADGRDSFAEPLLDAAAWPLEVVIAITARGEKDVGSGAGMMRSATASPYYGAWVDTHPADLDRARRAIAARDIAALAEVSEASCLKMHAAAIATEPPLLYWNGVTVECIHRVRDLRRAGIGVFFTIDAGPQLKAVCEPGASEAVAAALSSVGGVIETIRTGLGPGLEYP